MSFQMNFENSLDSLSVMRHQEVCAYQVVDYLSVLPFGPLHLVEAPVDTECRHIMAKWCIDICDFCHYSRETAAIALNCLDRFMATSNGQQILLDRDQYQLAAMTALYSAVKIHEHEAMDPALVSSLSRGAHSAEAVERMEQRLLTALQWRLNPPTAYAFARAMLDVIPPTIMGTSVRETVLELTNLQIELAFCDYQFSLQMASHVALASIVNAMESIDNNGSGSSVVDTFEYQISNMMNMDRRRIRDIRIALYEAVNGHEPMDVSFVSSTINDEEKITDVPTSPGGGYHSSPRSVAV